MTKKVYINAAGEAVSLSGDPTTIVGLRFEFDDNTSEVLEFAKVPAANKLRSEFHGYSQKIGDSYAGAGDAESPLAYAKAAVKETIAQVYANEWRATKAAGPRTSDLAVAMARISGETVEAAQAYIDSLDDAAKKVLRAKPKVKATLAAIVAEKATKRAAALAEAAANATE